MKRMKDKKSGFTMIELLVVVAIIGILAGIGIASYGSANKKARDGKRKADIESIRSALEMYKADAGSYPTTWNLETISTTYINPLPSPPPNSRCGGSRVYRYNDYSCVYSSDGSTYTIKIDLETGGVYERPNP